MATKYNNISLEEINEKAMKTFKIKWKVKDVFYLVSAIAKGQIVTPMNYIPFKKVILEHPDMKENLIKEANKLLDDLISYVQTQDGILAGNAFTSKKVMSHYACFLKEYKKRGYIFPIKEIAVTIEPQFKNENISMYLKKAYKNIMSHYFDKEQGVTLQDIAFVRSYETAFLGSLSNIHQLLDEFLIYMKEHEIPHQSFTKNEIYNQMSSYFNFFQSQMEKQEEITTETIHKMKNLQKRCKVAFGKVAITDEFSELIQQLKDYIVIYTVKQYDGTLSFTQFCWNHGLSFQGILTRLERTNDKELLKNIKDIIEKEALEEQQKKEREFQSFVSTLTELYEREQLDFFTIAHYYSLIDIPLEQMVRKIEKIGNSKLSVYIRRFYLKNIENEKSYSNVKVTINVASYLEEVRNHLKHEQFPRKAGILMQALEFARKGQLDQFTKDYFIQDINEHIHHFQKTKIQ